MTARQANQALAGFLLLVGTLLTAVSAAFLFAPQSSVFGLIENNSISAMGLGTAGALTTAWSLVLFNSKAGDQRPFAMASAAGLALLAFVRFSYAVLSDAPSEFLQVEFLEGIVFTVLSVVFFCIGLGDLKIIDRFVRGAMSLWGAPRWVFFWVMFILVPVNLASLFFLDHPIGVATLLGFLYIAMFNMPMLLMQQGVSRATSIPHVLPFALGVMLVAVWLFSDLTTGLEAGSALYYYAWILLITNSISLILDILDSVRWVLGDRAPIPPRG